ncbi:uncharacterized protein LOC116164570 [Photinus pyralis]|uniref:uncharacterized protein LOC116164570 n=1 Tax=Photinus pyralis TaxID=7054 RepID=UPI0012674AA9|nr:uncharacterized protein LOC116164570 [Photinus pyralis]
MTALVLGSSISSTPIRTPYVYYDRSRIVLPNNAQNLNEAVGALPVTLSDSSKTRTFFCIYCKKHYAKFPQHLMVSHKNEPAVSQFMALPLGCPERRRLIETIRRNGDYMHNTESIHNSGNFYVARRSYGNYNSLNYLPCPSCKGFFKKSTLRLHHKKCGGENVGGKKSIHLGRSISRQLHAKACFTLRTRIFPILRDDECVNIIRYDFLAITLANYWCAMYADSHFDEMIRARLRLIGRLLLAVKSLGNSVTDFCSIMIPTKYDVVVAAINKVAGLNEQGTIYKAPTTATMLTTICKKAADIWQIECIKLNDFGKKKDAENFLHLFKYSSA